MSAYFRTTKYSRDTLHTQSPARLQLALELFQTLRMQPGQQQIQSSPSNQ